MLEARKPPKNILEYIPAMLYFGSTLGVVFAGDLFTLFIFWELMSITALFLIWFNKSQDAQKAGFRYIIWHIFGGICLLGGIILHLHNTGSIDLVKFPWGDGSRLSIFLPHSCRIYDKCGSSTTSYMAYRCLSRDYYYRCYIPECVHNKERSNLANISLRIWPPQRPHL
jgi:hypothetical protein